MFTDMCVCGFSREISPDLSIRLTVVIIQGKAKRRLERWTYHLLLIIVFKFSSFQTEKKHLKYGKFILNLSQVTLPTFHFAFI